MDLRADFVLSLFLGFLHSDGVNFVAMSYSSVPVWWPSHSSSRRPHEIEAGRRGKGMGLFLILRTE